MQLTSPKSPLSKKSCQKAKDKKKIVETTNGSVFYTGEPSYNQQTACSAPAKHVITLNDHPEIVIRTKQSEASIRRLFDVNDSLEILVNTMSPDDPHLEVSDTYYPTKGNVLLAKPVGITVKVNNHPVIFVIRKATGETIKETAISQGAVLEEDAILTVKKDGINVPIDDDEIVCLSRGLWFKAISPDDNSYGATSIITAAIETAISELKLEFPGNKIEIKEVADCQKAVQSAPPVINSKGAKDNSNGRPFC